MTLAHINQFSTTDPVKLGRELSDLEDNVSAELDSVRAAAVPLPAVRSFMATASRGIVSIQPDQQLSIDTSIADASVVFPPLIPENFGRRFLFIKRTLANQVKTSCADSTVLCNVGAFPVFGAGVVGAFIFYCDASGYYR